MPTHATTLSVSLYVHSPDLLKGFVFFQSSIPFGSFSISASFLQASLIHNGRDLMEVAHLGLSSKVSVHCLAVDLCIYSHLVQQEISQMASNRE